MSAIVLAAGASARMGRPKQLLPLRGRPVLQHVLDAAASSGLAEILLVLGGDAPAIREAIALPAEPPTRVLVVPPGAPGKSDSLRLGLRAADPRAVAAAVLLGDQPGVSAREIARLAAVFLAAGAAAARPLYGSEGDLRIPGHPVFLARRIWPEIEVLQGDSGARSLFAARPAWLLEIPVAGRPPADLDTWEDYRRAVERNGA